MGLYDAQGTYVSVHITGMREFIDDVRSMGRRAGNFLPVWPKVGRIVSRAFQTQFATEGKAFGTPWSPLQPRYAQWKRRHGYTGGILVRQGDMISHFTSRPMNVEQYRRLNAEFGSRGKIEQFHQDGTRRGLPPRPMLTPRLVDAVAEQATELLIDHIVGKKG